MLILKQLVSLIFLSIPVFFSIKFPFFSIFLLLRSFFLFRVSFITLVIFYLSIFFSVLIFFVFVIIVFFAFVEVPLAMGFDSFLMWVCKLSLFEMNFIWKILQKEETHKYLFKENSSIKFFKLLSSFLIKFFVVPFLVFAITKLISIFSLIELSSKLLIQLFV